MADQNQIKQCSGTMSEHCLNVILGSDVQYVHNYYMYIIPHLLCLFPPYDVFLTSLNRPINTYMHNHYSQALDVIVTNMTLFTSF